MRFEAIRDQRIGASQPTWKDNGDGKISGSTHGSSEVSSFGKSSNVFQLVIYQVHDWLKFSVPGERKCANGSA